MAGIGLMPRINGRGDLLLGLAGVRSSIGGVNLPVLGGSQWLTDDLVIGQSLDASKTIVVQRDGSHPQDVAAHGASEIAAGGGRWQAVLKTTPKTTCFGALGDKPGATVYAASPDGTIAWKPDYQAARGMVLTDPSGHDVPVPDANPIDVQVLGPGQAIWIEPGNIERAVGTPVPVLALWPSRLRVATLNGVRWCVYGTNEVGLVAQPDGEQHGYILERSPNAFNHECRVINGELVIAWSVTQGEGPKDGRSVVLDVSLPRTDLRALLTLPPVAFSFTHPVIVAPFKDPNKVSGATYRIDSGELGVYTELPDPSSVIAAAKQTRVFVAHDSIAPWTPPASLRACDVPMLECYRVKSETLAYSVARWQAQVSTVLNAWPRDIGVIPMFYCQGGAPPDELWTVSEVLDGLRHLSEVVNLSPRVKVIAPFAYDRANGITAHPELRTAFAALLAAAERVGEAALTMIVVPTIPVPDPVPQPVESPMPDLTPDQKNEVCDAIGAVAAAAFGKDPASMSQGVRQAIDQDVTAISDLMLLAQAREGGASPQAVERAAAAGRLLQGR